MNRTPTPAALILAASFFAVPALAQTQEQRLLPSDPLTSDIFGYDVAFDGVTMVAGAPFATFSGVSQPGRAYVFERSGSTWMQVKKLLTPTLHEGSGFGTALALDGATIAAGANGIDRPGSENSGSVFMYERIAGVWTFTQEIQPATPETFGNFGVAVALRGDELLVGSNGATAADTALAGMVFVYHRVAGAWTPAGAFHAADADFDDNFGSSIAISPAGDTAVIGAIDDDHDERINPGSAYVFKKIGGVWTQAAKLTASDAGDGSLFGAEVAISGNGSDATVVVGAEQHDHSGFDQAGAAYIFREAAGGTWTELKRLIAPTPDPGDRFGCDVAIRGQTILVGAHLASVSGRTGAAYVFRDSAGPWVYDKILTASDAGNTNFGYRIAMGGDRAAITGPFYQTNRGAVYMFTGLHACAADFTGDGVVDFSDYLEFLNLFDAQDPLADLNQDGVVDFGDYLEFLNLFDLGC